MKSAKLSKIFFYLYLISYQICSLKFFQVKILSYIDFYGCRYVFLIYWPKTKQTNKHHLGHLGNFLTDTVFTDFGFVRGSPLDNTSRIMTIVIIIIINYFNGLKSIKNNDVKNNWRLLGTILCKWVSSYKEKELSTCHVFPLLAVSDTAIW